MDDRWLVKAAVGGVLWRRLWEARHWTGSVRHGACIAATLPGSFSRDARGLRIRPHPPPAVGFRDAALGGTRPMTSALAGTYARKRGWAAAAAARDVDGDRMRPGPKGLLSVRRDGPAPQREARLAARGFATTDFSRQSRRRYNAG
jgi:hypothetical protein